MKSAEGVESYEVIKASKGKINSKIEFFITDVAASEMNITQPIFSCQEEVKIQ